MGTHLNCINNICFYKEVDKNYTGCYLKIKELLNCALIGACAVIRSNTVRKNINICFAVKSIFIWSYGVVFRPCLELFIRSF